jgi:Spy/CpxP family protein refolding chaperone
MRRNKMNRIPQITTSAALAAGLAAALLAPLPAVAQQRGPGAGGRFLKRAMASLDLSADQQTKVQAIVESERPVLQQLRATMKDDAAALRSAANATSADAAAVGSAFLKVKSDRQALKNERANLVTRIEAVLTPAQKTKLEGYIAAMKDRRAMRGGAMAPAQ